MTIKDVAAKCGVSVSTVSRVLNNHPDVSAAVREKVMAAVEELHYIPNNSARDLVKPQASTIGVVVRGVGNPFFTSIITAVESEAEKYGYTIILNHIRSGEDELVAGAEMARSKRLKGLILMGGCYDYTPEQVASLDVPFVCCTFTNTFGNLGKDTFSSVSISDRDVAKHAVEHLIAKGHKKIAIILDSICDRSISELRYKGYLEALKSNGIEPDYDLVEEIVFFDMKSAYEGTLRLIDRGADFTALFVIADSLALAAMKALSDRGRKVPEDCSVISIDGIDMSLYSIPTLTTLIQPTEEMGRDAVRTLVSVIEENGKHMHLRYDTMLREGGTIAPPKAEI